MSVDLSLHEISETLLRIADALEKDNEISGQFLAIRRLEESRAAVKREHEEYWAAASHVFQDEWVKTHSKK